MRHLDAPHHIGRTPYQTPWTPGQVGRAGAFLSGESWDAIAAALRLSPRESEIAFAILLDDPSESGIADRLGISMHTVHTHIERVYRKLGVTSRSKLVAALFEAYVTLSLPSPLLNGRS